MNRKNRKGRKVRDCIRPVIPQMRFSFGHLRQNFATTQINVFCQSHFFDYTAVSYIGLAERVAAKTLRTNRLHSFGNLPPQHAIQVKGNNIDHNGNVEHPSRDHFQIVNIHSILNGEVLREVKV